MKNLSQLMRDGRRLVTRVEEPKLAVFTWSINGWLISIIRSESRRSRIIAIRLVSEANAASLDVMFSRQSKLVIGYPATVDGHQMFKSISEGPHTRKARSGYLIQRPATRQPLGYTTIKSTLLR